ncbi:uncharacterized protein MONOS_10348 [Monocercomonoides exilis]|uniref:uncharacterized protein n=1 Tax=Monocercomonoides exilis TaxID=2049356 RepID=UPI00355A20EC|nr:hypothetical protein MONOS_10348 [Monocercomonoides exilis]|eukprot:MONOS_10348.1-p1 / transcript=MONOS_10348.1 / gene=MONOS_10348 / organism=Monocercomonoides_exilis_PA203 / gene_product=unspecified product / transcript_product=unspecified product / location=Mono_scaffold00466:41558-42235(-) / protein_length=226 / sequence_SO=supercontig / SO=protein_coding / is_pseudo=false
MPGEHQLIYKSTTLYVGGEGSVDSRDCGRKEKPCQTIECTEDHVIFGKTNSFLVSGMHTLKKSSIPVDYTTFFINSQENDAATLVIPQALELYCDDVAVIYCVDQLISLCSLSIEYPLHFEHHPVDIILIEGDFRLISITLKPSAEEIEAYCNQFSVPFLDFKLIVARKGSLFMTNVIVIGAISEKAASYAIASIDPTLNCHQQEYGTDGIAVNSRKDLEGDASV